MKNQTTAKVFATYTTQPYPSDPIQFAFEDMR